MNKLKKQPELFNANSIIIPIFLGMVLLSYDLILSKFSFQLTEGWWETYAWLDSIKPLYSQTTLAFPPLFILIIKFLALFKLNFFEARIIFSFIHLIEFFLLVYLVSQYIPRIYALISAFIVESLLIIQNPVWIVKDYHLIVSILTICLIIVINKIFFVKNSNSIDVKRIFLVSILISLIFLIKQNIAICLIFSLFSIFIIESKNLNNIKFFVRLLILFTVVNLTCFSIFYGFNWIDAYFKNDSKGGLTVIFLRFLNDEASRKIVLTSFFLAFILFSIDLGSDLILRYFSSIRASRACTYIIKRLNTRNLELCLKLFFSLIISYLFMIYTGPLLLNVTLGILGFLLMRSLFRQGDNEINYAPGLILITGLVYAGTMTAGFNYVSSEIAMALSFAWLIRFLCLKKIISLSYTGVLITFLSVGTFYVVKINSDSYNWWGYSIESVRDSGYEVEIDKLRNISFDKNTSDILKKTSEIIGESKPSTSLLSIPSIPIFYFLYNKIPPISSPVLWFDVFPSKYLVQTLDAIKLNPPDLIFWLIPTIQAYDGHRNLKKDDLALIEIDKLLNEKVNLGEYQVIYAKPIITKNLIRNWRLYNDSAKNGLEFIFECQACSDKYLNKLKLTSQIAGFKKSNKSGVVSIVFINQGQLSDFIEKTKLSPINADFNTFKILRRVR